MEFSPDRNRFLKLYNKSIDIEISPENEVFSSFRFENLPDILNISYCDVTDIIDFFNTIEGGIIIQKVFQNEITLNIFPVDTTYISDYEREYLIGHESLLKRSNVNFYQIWYDPNISFDYHLGSTIHEALLPFIKRYRNYSFDYGKKIKHFLTLNNVHTPDREDLYKLYISLSDENKQKFISSFKFANIHLESEKESFDKIFNNFGLVFGESLFPLYDSSLIEIVCESSNEAVTEKCFKPLLSGIPFIHWISSSHIDNTLHQVKIFDSIGIDTRYFGIDYSDSNGIKQKLEELISLSIDEIREKYKDDFVKAEENKKKVYNYIDGITNKIIKK